MPFSIEDNLDKAVIKNLNQFKEHGSWKILTCLLPIIVSSLASIFHKVV